MHADDTGVPWEGVRTEAGPGRCREGRGGEGRQRAHPVTHLAPLTLSGFTLPEPVLHRSQSSPRGPRTPSSKNLDTCLGLQVRY